MIGAVRLDGPLVCSTLDGPVDAESFLARGCGTTCARSCGRGTWW
jgi:hypothetical protein